MKAIFKGQILDYEIADYSIVGGGKILLDGLKYKDQVVYWETFHERTLQDIKTQLYINDLVELEPNKTVKIINITKDLDGNRYYYTDFVVENRRKNKF